MPLRDCPFCAYAPIRVPSPILPLVVTNPVNKRNVLTFGLVDTGASATCVPDFIARRLGLDVAAGRKEEGLGARGKFSVYLHALRIDVLKLDEKGITHNDRIVHTIEGKIAVLEGLPWVLLGVEDFLKAYYLYIGYPVRSFSVCRDAT
jgi:hypothetical protein